MRKLSFLILTFSLIALLLVKSEIRGEDFSFANTGRSVYTPPQNWKITGYNKAPVKKEPVAPTGKQIVQADQTARIALTQNQSETLAQPVLTVPVPPTGKTDVPVDWNLDDETISANNRLSHFMLDPRPVRNSLFQGFSGKFTYLPDSGKYQSGQYQIDGAVSFGLPVPNTDSVFLISPLISWTQMTMPKELDFLFGDQKKLLKTGASVEYLLPLCNSLLFDGNVQIFYASDGKAGGSDTLRMNGYGALIWKMGPTAELVLGASYNDVTKNSIIPVGGILWRPSDDLYMELLFPRPKIAWRLPEAWCGACKAPYWFYVSGEYTAERWQIESNWQIPGVNNSSFDFRYEDIRIAVGIERKGLNEINWAIEGGIVLDRSLKFKSAEEKFFLKYQPGTVGFARFKVMY